jgi:Ca2+-binding EF-hand superfamily protein
LRRVPAIFCCLLALAACGPRRPPGLGIYDPNYRPPRDENFNGGPNAILLKYDTNHDGQLTRAELDKGLKAEFDSYDTGHTGCLNQDQVRAINQARIAQDQSTATPLQDWNQDGCIDLKEFSTTANSLFDELDRNRDGVISKQEFNPRPPGRGAPPEGAGERGRRGGNPGP